MLAGMDWDDVAREIDEPNYGATTLKRLDADSNAKLRAAYKRIAEATGVPVSFFTAPLAQLGPAGGAGGDALPDQVRALDLALSETRDQVESLRAELLQLSTRVAAAVAPPDSASTARAPARGQRQR